jgi:hypothetical protein
VSLVLIAGPVLAQDGKRWFAARPPGPVGTIYALGPIEINSRSFSGHQAVWNGDLLQTYEESGAAVAIDSIGEVRLERNTTVRVSTGSTNAEMSHELVAALTEGTIEVRLAGDAKAYVHCNGFSVRAIPGSSFRVRMTPDRPLIDCMNGYADVESQVIESRLITTFGGLGGALIQVPCPLGRYCFKIKKKLQGKITVRNMIERTAHTALAYAPVGTSSLARQLQEPAKGRKVQFSLKRGIGSFDQDVKTTGSEGLVEVEFTAFDRGESAEITAQVIDLQPGETAIPWVGTITVEAPWLTWKKSLIIGSIAAVAALIPTCCRSDPGPLRKQDPPVIFPPQ